MNIVNFCITSALKFQYIVFLFVFFIGAISAFSQTKPNNINISAGLPFKTNDSNYFIIERQQYVVSISKDLNVANWVSYYLCKNDFGAAKRYAKNFISDTSLPTDYYKVKHADYTNSGYDRGHLVRSEERTKSKQDNITTFYLTNIIPQTPDLNRLIWLQFERYCQKLCTANKKHLYIVTGGACYSNKKIKEKISVPDSCWKVVLVLDSNQALSDVNAKNQTIAVMMPNVDNLKKRKWNEFITTIRNVEKSTGYDFFSNIDSKIQDIIEVQKYQP